MKHPNSYISADVSYANPSSSSSKECELTEKVRTHYSTERGMELQHMRCIDRSTRAVFKIKESTVGYFPVTKNATTTIKFLFAEILNIARYYRDYEGIPLHQQKRLGCMPIRFHLDDKSYTVLCGYPHIPIHEFLPARHFVRIPNLDIRLCIIRDPIERCVSMYSNRILFHREKDAKNFDSFLNNLEEYGRNSMNFLPQYWFLGDDMSYYTHIFTMKDVPRLIEFLSDLSGMHLKNKLRQTGGKDKKPKVSSAQKRRIREIFARDYELIGDFL